jgi:hypothetical protein
MPGMKRFSIRDLFWLTLVIAICAAWWVDHKASLDYREYYKYKSDLDQLYQRNKANYGPLAKSGTAPIGCQADTAWLEANLERLESKIENAQK